MFTKSSNSLIKNELNQWIGINNDEILAQDFSYGVGELLKPMCLFTSEVFIVLSKLFRLDIKVSSMTTPKYIYLSYAPVCCFLINSYEDLFLYDPIPWRVTEI